MQKALRTVWENGYCRIGDKIARAKEGLSIGSCISPVMADLVMNDWEKIVIGKGRDRLLLFCRYVDDCFGVWKGSTRQLDKFIKELNDEKKGIILESEMEKDRVLNFLDIKVEKMNDGRLVTSWYQKECASGIFWHKRSDVDEVTKLNFKRNTENRIEKITMEEEQKKKDMDRLWNELKENGYNEEDRRKTRRWKKRKEVRSEGQRKIKKWFWIKSRVI